jgi:hypothetical protein
LVLQAELGIRPNFGQFTQFDDSHRLDSLSQSLTCGKGHSTGGNGFVGIAAVHKTNCTQKASG